MNCKILIATFTIVHVVATQKSILGISYDKLDYDCSIILSSMDFLNNPRCVQFIFGYELYSVECIKTIIENSKNVTFYIRSLTWLLNRNIYVEESSLNIMNKKSTKYCAHFLIVLKDFHSVKPLLDDIKNNVSIVTIFPYSKLYFMYADKKFKFSPSPLLNEISKFFYEKAQFGYVFELDEITRTTRLRDFLSLNVQHIIPSNLNHPFVNRKNNQKEFRLSFYNCSPFVIYVDEKNFR